MNRISKAYAIENALVLLMLGSAIALQIMRRKQGQDRGPLLLRLLDKVPEVAKPWPLVAIDALLPHE